MPDEEIIANCTTKPSLFGLLIDRYEEAFLRKAFAIVKSKETAQDIVQDTFLKIYKNAHNFTQQEDASFNSWAYRILMNTAFTYYQRKKKEYANTVNSELWDEDFMMEIADENEEHEKAVTGDLVQSILAKMPGSLKRVLELYFLEEKSQKEIARSEHLSNEAVRVRIHRAKKYFRDISMKML